MRLHHPLFRTGLTAVFLSLAACDGNEPVPVEPVMSDVAEHAAGHAHARPATSNPEVARWLAELRQATVRYRDLSIAADDGWDTPITDCMSLDGVGAMGVHYGNGAAPFDDTLDELRPELLVYEPMKNGRERLVAVEYAIPFGEWHDDDPPSFHGIEFLPNSDFGLWVLHAWIWKHNPAGMFENWNPTVSCQYYDPGT